MAGALKARTLIFVGPHQVEVRDDALPPRPRARR